MGVSVVTAVAVMVAVAVIASRAGNHHVRQILFYCLRSKYENGRDCLHSITIAAFTIACKIKEHYELF